MTAIASTERPDLPTLTEPLPLDNTALAAALAAAAAALPASPLAAKAEPATMQVDIELPFKVRAIDEARRGDAADGGAMPTHHAALHPPVTTPFAPLLDRLLDAGPGRYGLHVEVKHDHRVVGIWTIDLARLDASNIHASQASAVLYACVAADGDPRSTAAFLVLGHWWVNGADPLELDELYDDLTYAVLDRLDELMEGRADLARMMPPYVLYLVDGRRKKPRIFKTTRLEHALLRALGGGRAVPGLELHVAHGRGTGVSPLLATLPTDLSPADFPPPDFPVFDSESAQERPTTRAAPLEPLRRRAGEVFIPERLSETNLRWMRKSSIGPS